MTVDTTGAIHKAIEALNTIYKEMLLNNGVLHREHIAHLCEDNYTTLQAVLEEVDSNEINMAVYGGKDTQEARAIKHHAAKLLHKITQKASEDE